jgi:hypothetical protein
MTEQNGPQWSGQQPQPGQQPYGQQWGPQPGGGYQPYTPQQQPKRKNWMRRHKFLSALIALALLVVAIILGGTAGGGGSGTSSSSSGGGVAANNAGGNSTPGIGQPAADGKFRFVVTSITHASKAGDSFLNQHAQGRYTVLHITVTNIGSESQTLDDSAQFVYDASGRKFDADSQADIYGNPGGSGGVFFNDINPGNTVHGLLFFDLPKNDRAVKAELHDSMFSGGVTVSLAG